MSLESWLKKIKAKQSLKYLYKFIYKHIVNEIKSDACERRREAPYTDRKQKLKLNFHNKAVFKISFLLK